MLIVSHRAFFGDSFTGARLGHADIDAGLQAPGAVTIEV